MQSLLVNYSFVGDGYVPALLLVEHGSKDIKSAPLPRGPHTISIDTSERSCCGWHDLETSTSHPCPDASTMTNEKYSQCVPCRERTGFNPAFYNSSELSEQQAKRNANPHSLYLAYFGDDVIKVGISHTARGLKRLLEQGARSAVILAEYPNADLARSAEAKIARMDGIRETLRASTKHKLLPAPYDQDAAEAFIKTTIKRLPKDIQDKSQGSEIIHLGQYYLPNTALNSSSLVILDSNQISGQFIGMVGDCLIASQDDTQFALPIGKLLGYQITIKPGAIPNDFEPHQSSLF